MNAYRKYPFRRNVPAFLLAILILFVQAAGTGQAASTTLFGNTSINPNQDSNAAGMAEVFQITALENGTVNKLYVYLDTGSTSTQIVLGLYANGANNEPGALLTQAGLANPGSGKWVSVAVPPVGVTKGTQYWIAILGAYGSGVMRFRDSSCCGKSETSRAANLTALPAAWTVGSVYSNAPISAYAVQEDAGPTATLSFTPSASTTRTTLPPTFTPTSTLTFTPTTTRTSTSTPTPTNTLPPQPTFTLTSTVTTTSTTSPTSTNPPSQTPSYTPTQTGTSTLTNTPAPSSTLTPTLSATSTPTNSATPLPTNTLTATSTFTPTATLEPAAPAAFAVGPGAVDVIPRQIVRASDDRVYLFAIKGNRSDRIESFWSRNPGLPGGTADFQAGPELGEPVIIISVDTAYDGLNTIHVLTNLSNGTLRDHPFDVSSHSFRPAITLAPNTLLGSPASAATAIDIGTSGVSSMFDRAGRLNLLYWSTGSQITHLALNYDPLSNSFSKVSGPTRVDTLGTDNNHPAAAVSPLDDSLTVAWVSGSSGAGKIFARTRSVDGVWGDAEQVNGADVWTSSYMGLNIDQGPSLVIDSVGVQHLAYIETSQPGYDYGRVHYVRSAGTGWVDQYAGFLSNDPALALDNQDNLFLLGHGDPADPACTSYNVMCVSQRAEDGTWSTFQLIASPPAGVTFDASVSVKWSVIGWNRPETIEFVFFSTPYATPTLYYGHLGNGVAIPTPVPGNSPTPTFTTSPTPSPTTAVTRTPTVTRTPVVLPSATNTRTPRFYRTPTRTPTIYTSPTRTPTPTVAARSSTPTSTSSTGGFPSTGLLDMFNRANGAIGSSWSGKTGGYAVSSNQLSIGTGGELFWSASSFGTSQEVFVTFNAVDPAAAEQDLLLKSQSATGWTSGVIEVWYQAASHRVQVWTYSPAQGWVQRGADIAVTFANGDQFGARSTANGSVEVFRNGVLVGSRDASAWSFSGTGGYIGLWFITAPNTLLDNFGGGTLP